MSTGRLPLVVLLVALALAPLVLPEYYVTLLNYIGLYGIVALGLVLLTGVGGLTSFGQAAFVGLGAYTTAYLSTVHGVSPWVTLGVGFALTAVVALVLGFLTLRLSGHYLPLGTIAWGISLYYLFGNLQWLGGQTGLSGIPPISIFGRPLESGRQFFYLIWLAAIGALLSIQNLLDSRSGRAIRSLRGGGLMAESFGVNTAGMKIVIFVYAALLAALSGWLYAHLLRFVNPTPFSVNFGIEYLFMVVVGGAGYVWGAILGAALLTVLREWLSDVLPKLVGQAGEFEIIALGILLVLLLQRARGGVMGLLARLLPVGTKAQAPPSAAALPVRARPPAGECLLDVRRATKRFGGLTAVSKISFELVAGEILGLIGPNGAGKSTTFNLVTGVLPLTEGEIHFRGERIAGLPSREVAKRGIARTFQHVHLRPNMTVLENVAIGAHLRGRKGVLAALFRLEREEEKRLLVEAKKQLERVGLGGELDELAGSLPLGSQRILEIARALCADPVLLLLDEPAAGLRYKEKQQLAELLRKLKAEGMSVLLVEHDMDFVMHLVDRLVVMHFGEKIAEGLPKDVQANPVVVEAYLGGRRVSSAARHGGENGSRTDVPALEVRELAVAYGKVEALHKASLRVPPRSIVTVIGPNGAGKTTLLNAIMGLLPTRGSVHYEGADVTAAETETRVAHGLCLVPERRELFAEMTVGDNLLLGAFPRFRRRESGIDAELEAVYRRFPQLKEREQQLAGTLSGGECQMLALGRALMAKPKVLMLDEPSLGLAPLIVREIFRIITELRETGVSLLLVEQNARAALQVADYGYVLETGDVVLEGPAAELAQNLRVIETYLGLAKRTA